MNKIIVTVIFSIGLSGLLFAQPEVSREKRELAYAKLHEAQRYIWTLSRTRSQSVFVSSFKAAKLALQKAVELNPNLAEAYTALAELNINVIPGNPDDAILFAGIASKINPDNFGARQILARVYSEKSKVDTATLDPDTAEKAIAQWKEVARLDPRNAEAWAFLSIFYEKQRKTEQRIEALNKWLAGTAPAPQEQYYYRKIFGKSEDLAPENAALRLGDALVKAGRYAEAVDVLSTTVVDQPGNALAVDLLRQAIQGGGKTGEKTIELLRQAVFANPQNLILVELLSDAQINLGKTDDAIKTLKNSIQSLGAADKNSVANLQVSLGDLYFHANRPVEAISTYEQALTTFGIEKTLLNNEDQREFAVRVFEKMIQTLKSTGKAAEVKAIIERARTLLGKDDLFADKQLISFLRDSGLNADALVAVRSVRKNFGNDYALLRTEATILAESGRVEEGVALIKGLIAQKTGVPSAYFDDFSNYLFISGLYTQAKKPKEAIESAQKAQVAAGNNERKQLATISLAIAQNLSGNFMLAETTLRGVLRQTPDNPIALNNLGYFLVERNERVSEAVDLIEQALKIDPTNSSYLDSLGWGYFKLGKLMEAERVLKEAIRYNPLSSASFEHLGDVYVKSGNSTQAKSVLQKALVFSTDAEAKNRIKTKINGLGIN